MGVAALDLDPISFLSPASIGFPPEIIGIIIAKMRKSTVSHHGNRESSQSLK